MFEIHTLRLGELMIPQGESLLRDPIHAWYVTDGTTRILVDVGMPGVEETRRRLGIAATGGGPDSLVRTLGECGTDPGAIDIIIATHLHFDHAWNLDLFPQACVVVQRDEVFHAVDPVATQRIYYLRETLLSLLARKKPSGLRLIDGDVDLMPGVRLMKVPGHTPGMQVPIVSTTKGKVALVSDLGDHYRCWFPADPRATEHPMRFMTGSYLPGAIRSESERVYQDSMARVQAACDIVIPAHDFRIPSHIPAEWFEVPASTRGDLSHSKADHSKAAHSKAAE
ncbi:MBL fold metallo-hydrolase [Chelatococcus asaccharovorans]|uniref:Metallo-beta-lactamase superfamily protein n=1 Tax=Chelatococcus asaccharovorans TaxID=28210 RepID=A0A2V3UPD2_9HYPH|nr:MBL fold metallo-hydrolase [Chelatococcus asaccharovorans]MBS7703646.1 MBL fold metallo-hydrolase [Chelatococcus asaccharovorans]PXW61990.1 metallo-beta-lactamase superfamily protein [Chelatococcus asaccharovorans]